MVEKRIEMRNGKPFILCLVRNKWFAATPEEIVRQLWLEHLHRRYGYSLARLAVEVPVTQLPPPSPPPSVTAAQNATSGSQRVAVVDFDIPFGSVLKIMFKWMAAAFVVFCCFLPAIIILWLIVAAVVAALIGGAMSSMHHP